MRLTLNIGGWSLVVFGSIWFLQGIGVLPGSFIDRPNSMGGLWRDGDSGRYLDIGGDARRVGRNGNRYQATVEDRPRSDRITAPCWHSVHKPIEARLGVTVVPSSQAQPVLP
jgi:hypothetical protein